MSKEIAGFPGIGRDTQTQRDIVLPGVGRSNETNAEVLSNVIISHIEAPGVPYPEKTRIWGSILMAVSVAILIFFRIGLSNYGFLIAIYISLGIVAYSVHVNNRYIERVGFIYITLIIFFLLLSLSESISNGLGAFSALLITILLIKMMYVTRNPLLIIPALYSFIYLLSILFDR
jgi:hypothetical protein